MTGIAQDTMVTNASDHEEDTTQLPRLVWTELRISDRRARIQSLPADPNEYIDSNVSFVSSLFEFPSFSCLFFFVVNVGLFVCL